MAANSRAAAAHSTAAAPIRIRSGVNATASPSVARIPAPATRVRAPPTAERAASIRPLAPPGTVLPVTSWKATDPQPLATLKSSSRATSDQPAATDGSSRATGSMVSSAAAWMHPAVTHAALRRGSRRMLPDTASCGSREPACLSGTSSATSPAGAPIAANTQGSTSPGLASCSASFVQAPLATFRE